MVEAVLLPFVAGLVTLLNPCVLPLLPIVVGSALGENRYGPAALTAGLVSSFAVFGFLLLTVGFAIGLDQEVVRFAAAVILIVAGVLLLVPRAQMAFALATAPVASSGNRLLEGVSGRGLGGQFAIGAILGLVWVPCVGPTLGVAIAAASRGENLLSAFLVFLVFGIGVATALLAFAYGSRKALATRKAMFQSAARWSKPILGALLLIVGTAIATGFDKTVETLLLNVLPVWLINLTVSI